jgi:hypothetical protein
MVYIYIYIYNFNLHFFWLFCVSFLTISVFFGMKLSLRTNLVLNWPVLSFPERFQPIAAAAMYTVTINVPELMHLMLSLSISYLYLNRISWLCRQHPREDEASNWGVQLRPNRAWLSR